MYRIELSQTDLHTIAFVGGRYAWSNALLALACEDDNGTATLELAEHEAWELSAAFESDTEGGHSYFPMLDSHSDLAFKLAEFVQSIV